MRAYVLVCQGDADGVVTIWDIEGHLYLYHVFARSVRSSSIALCGYAGGVWGVEGVDGSFERVVAGVGEEFWVGVAEAGGVAG